MKKPTPFQKKVTRWFGGLRLIQWAQGASFLAPLIVSIIIVASISNEILMVIVTVAGVTLGAFMGIRMDYVKSYWNQLPETQAKKAEEFIQINSKYAKRIDELIREAYVQDDGGDLREALEKFKILAGKEKYLADLPNQVEKFKTEITALEKELGLNS